MTREQMIDEAVRRCMDHGVIAPTMERLSDPAVVVVKHAADKIRAEFRNRAEWRQGQRTRADEVASIAEQVLENRNGPAPCA